jgi:hypothetical protein
MLKSDKEKGIQTGNLMLMEGTLKWHHVHDGWQV